MVGAGLESGWWMVGEMVVQCLNCPKAGRMSVRGRRKGALPCGVQRVIYAKSMRCWRVRATTNPG